jgi:hypothetical protein
MKNSDYELVALYGFSAKYPKNARLELNPRSTSMKGDIVFHFKEGFKIFLSWGSLEEAKKRFLTVAAHASGSFEHSVKSVRGELDGAPETGSLKIKGHDAVYTHARMFIERGGLLFGTRRITQDIYALHLHCDRSARYYVLYAFVQPKISGELAKIFEQIMSSLRCHSLNHSIT